MKNKILVSGAGGFVGTALREYCGGNDCDFTALSLRNNADPAKQLVSSDAIIHLAGKAHDLRKSPDPAAYYTINTELTKKLFDAFLASDIPVFIMMSSVKAVVDATDGVLTEDATPNPQTDYGKSKRLAEEYILKATLPAGKRVYILRPCMIHGPGNKGNLNLLYRFAKMGLPYPLAAFKNRRSFLSVENLCFAILEMVKRPDIEPGIYQVADDASLSTNRVMQLFGEVMGKHTRFVPVPAPLVKAIAAIGNVIPFPLSSEKLRKLTESYEVSNQKLVSALQKPLPVSSEEGLRHTIRSFMSAVQ